jgi:Zn ribbon nucleic-acid-binding protein
MKKIIISLLLVAMISIMIIPAYAAGTSITVEEEAIEEGETTVAIDVAITGNTGFANGKFTLDYNKEVLTLTAIEVEGKLLENGSVAANVEKATISFASAEEITEDGVLFTAVFAVNANAEVGKYSVKVSAQDMVTTDGVPVTVETATSTGAVEVTCDHNWKKVIDKENGIQYEECTKCGAKQNEAPIVPDTGDSMVQTVMMMVSVIAMIAVAGTVSYRRRLSK